MNIIEKFNEGQLGLNRGLFMGEGLAALSAVLHGVQKARAYGVGAAPKVGKTTLVDAGFVIEPYLDALLHDIPVDFIYFSYEIDRISKEFDFICYFLARDYGLFEITLPENQLVKGKNLIDLSSDYLKGHVYDDNKVLVMVSSEIKTCIIAIYTKYIIPMFGEYAQNGVQIKKGVIDFYAIRENPTGMRKKIIAHAEQRGKFLYEQEVGSKGTVFTKKVGYTSTKPNRITIVVTDHIRKLELERGFLMKQTIDKWLEYCTELRNLCYYSFVHIVHINRSMADVKRMMYMDDRLYPTSEDVKDSGNLPEEVNYMITMFNPNDDKYNLKKHFGTIIKDPHNNLLYPDLKTLHLVESRHCSYPQHFAVNMKAKIFKTFKAK